MSALKGKYSPPYDVNVLGEETLTFKRMLAEEWDALSEQIKQKAIEAENAKINAEMANDPPNVRQMARVAMRDYFEQEVTLSRVIRESSNTAKGIRRLLKFALVEQDKADWLELISPTDMDAIVGQIVYLPVVKPADPQKLPPPSAAQDGGSESVPPSPTGQDTPPTSSTSSPESTPAS